jgi:multiple sugar transport system ATP-binding protein
LKQLHRSLKATMIYVTHDQVEALTLGDRIAVMNQGVVQQVGPPLEVYDRPCNRFVAGFVGTPPMNFIAGRVEVRDGRVGFAAEEISAGLPPGAASRLPGDAAGQDVWMGIRPEDVLVDAEASQTEDRQTTNRGTVTMVETAGDESLVHVSTGSGSCVVSKTGTRTTLEADDRVSLGFRMERAHFFDSRTGDNLIYARR